MGISWLMIGILVLIVLFFVSSRQLAHNVIDAAKRHEREAPIPHVTWCMGTVTVILGIGLAIALGLKLFEGPGYAVMTLALVIALWYGMVITAKRLVLYYYPGTTFQQSCDIAIDVLGQKRPGFGLIMSVL